MALVRDLLLFLGCWFAVALAIRLYARPNWTRLLATWLTGITAAVLIRATIVGTLGRRLLRHRARVHAALRPRSARSL